MFNFNTSLINSILSHRYIHAIAIIIGSLLLAKLVLWFFKTVVEKMTKKSSSKLDDKIVLRIEHPIIVLIILVGSELALQKISYNTMTLQNLLMTGMIIVITYMFIGVSHIALKFWQKKHEKDNDAFHEEVIPLIRSLSKIILTTTGLVIILQLWGIAVGALLTSVGVIGIVLGFAFKDTMSNIFGGISLIMDDSMKKKDIIELEGGDKGEVVEINLRSTKIKTFDNNFLIIPNGILSITKIKNFAQPTNTFRVEIPFGVTYGNEITNVKEIALSVLKGREDVLKFPKRFVRLEKLGDFALEFKLCFFISNYKEMFNMKDIITSNLYTKLKEENIEIAFPTRTIYSEIKIKSEEKKVKTQRQIKKIPATKKQKKENKKVKVQNKK